MTVKKHVVNGVSYIRLIADDGKMLTTNGVDFYLMVDLLDKDNYYEVSEDSIEGLLL